MTAVKKLLSVGTCFDDFKDFLCDLERLKKEQNHPFRVYNSEKAEHYNKRLINASNSSPAVDCTKIPYTYYSVRCIHYGEPRPSHGKSIPKSLRTFRKGCQAMLTLSYDK